LGKATLYAVLLGAFLLPTPHSNASEVPKADPSYAAVQSLANEGLIGGYAQKQDVFQSRLLNRYEMAALVKRAADRVAELQSSPAGPKPSAQALANLAKLIDSYAVELSIMGVETTPLKASTKALADQVAAQQKQIDKLDKSKVTSGFGSIKFDGLWQVMYSSGADVTCTGAKTGAISNTFRIRHCDLKFSGTIDKQAYWWLLFDPSRNSNLSIPAAPATVATNTVSPLYDYVLGYHAAPNLDIEVGQQKLPLSLETLRSSGALLTYDRSIMNLAPWGGGKCGESRDLGFWVRYNKPKTFSGILSVTNDAGNRQDTVDDNNSKELCLNGQILAVKNLTFGGWGEISGGVGASYRQRRRAGVDIDYVNGKTEFVAEYGEGFDGDAGNRLKSQGAYATYAYQVSKQWQGVIRGDMFNPNRDMHNQETDLTVGVNYFMNGNNSKIQLNYVNKHIAGPLGSSATAYGAAAQPTLGVSRSMYVVNVQQAF
jgi:hypothetical protein